MTNKVGAVIVAAGRGSRMGTTVSKQFLLLQGKPVAVHTLEAFQRHERIGEIVLVVGSGDVETCTDWVRVYGLSKVKAVIAGGGERQHSVHLGLKELKAEWVMVHDGVRPFIGHAEIEACYAKAQETGASVLAVPVKDTIKQVDAGGLVTATPDRSSLWSIQTPQTFRLHDLLQAYAAADRDGFLGTDDSSLAERIGIRVSVAEGSYRNIKLTTPEDLDYAEYILSDRGANHS